MMKGLFVLLYWLSPLVPIMATLAAYPGRYASIADALPMLLGATAFTWLMAQLVLSARIRFIERQIGLDRLLKVHALTPSLVIVLAFVHKFIMESLFGNSLKTLMGNTGLFFLLAMSALAVVFMGGMRTHLPPPAQAFLKRLTDKRFFGYNWQRILHNLMPVGAIILFLHVQLSSSARFSLAVRLIYILYFSLAMGAWLWHKILRPWHQKRNPFTVREVRSETAGIWTLRLTAPTGPHFRHAEGQFGFFRFLTGKLSQEPHPFSFSDMQDEYGTLTITVKALGDYTRTIGQAQPGDLVAVDGPYGRFTPSLHGYEKLVLLAGGIGITPMLSILSQIRQTSPFRPVLLLWGINKAEELIRVEDVKDMQAVMPAFHFVPVAFRDPGFTGETGVVDQEKIERFSRAHGFDGNTTGYYLCGPTPMMLSVRKDLRRMGIPRSHIHDERFSL